MAMGGAAAGPLIDAGLTDRPVPKGLLLLAAVRSLGVVGATLLVYSLLPIRPETGPYVVFLACVSMVLLGVVFVRQVGRISRSPHPVLAAVEALCLVFGMFLTLFAFMYVSMSATDPATFTQVVDKVAGVYFSVTVLATVGFGDISAVSDLARIMVTVQMIIDLVLIGVTVKLLGTVARRAVEARLALGPGEPVERDPGAAGLVEPQER